MPRYHFDIRVGDCLIQDTEGTELGGRGEAREYALEEIRELLETRAGAKFDLAHARVEVADAAKQLLFAVPFPEALRATPSLPRLVSGTGQA